MTVVGALALAGWPIASHASYEYPQIQANSGPDTVEFPISNAIDNAILPRSTTRYITPENPYSIDLLPTANTAIFVGWLRDQIAGNEITQRQLTSLYYEFCDSEFEPLATGSLFRQIKKFGIQSRRLTPKKLSTGKYRSPTVYRIQPVKQPARRRV